MIRYRVICQFDPTGVVFESDDSIGYTCAMTVPGLTPEAPVPADVVYPPDNRPIFVIAHQHGQYLDFIRRNGLDHWTSPRVTRHERLAGLSNCRIVLLQGWARLTDAVEIREALAYLRGAIGVTIIECDPGGACSL